MKRSALLKHLARHNCYIEREGARHTIVKNISTNKKTPLPRHNELPDLLCGDICKQLGIPKP